MVEIEKPRIECIDHTWLAAIASSNAAVQRRSLRLARIGWHRRSFRPEGRSIVSRFSGPTSRINRFLRLSSRYTAASSARHPAPM